MEKARKIVITSALPYANGDIHLGHLLEHMITDFWARFQKMRGHTCLAICADDAHKDVCKWIRQGTNNVMWRYNVMFTFCVYRVNCQPKPVSVLYAV